MNDADIEMMELERAGNIFARLKRKGICLHGWVCAPIGKEARCNECGKVWPTAWQMEDEQRNLRAEYL